MDKTEPKKQQREKISKTAVEELGTTGCLSIIITYDIHNGAVDIGADVNPLFAMRMLAVAIDRMASKLDQHTQQPLKENIQLC